MSLLRKLSNLSGFGTLSSTLINIATAGSVTEIQTSIAQLTTIIYHHRGSPRLWLVVPPQERAKFERKIRDTFEEKLGNSSKCSQFVKHLSIFVTPDMLKIWDVKFIQVYQIARQLVILSPLAYFWGYSTGHSIIETRNWTGSSWDLRGYQFCGLDSQFCQDAHTPDKPILHITQQHLDGRWPIPGNFEKGIAS
jgi:hypothetical protein